MPSNAFLNKYLPEINQFMPLYLMIERGARLAPGGLFTLSMQNIRKADC
jgi:hypothetical protein